MQIFKRSDKESFPSRWTHSPVLVEKTARYVWDGLVIWFPGGWDIEILPLKRPFSYICMISAGHIAYFPQVSQDLLQKFMCHFLRSPSWPITHYIHKKFFFFLNTYYVARLQSH